MAFFASAIPASSFSIANIPKNHSKLHSLKHSSITSVTSFASLSNKHHSSINHLLKSDNEKIKTASYVSSSSNATDIEFSSDKSLQKEESDALVNKLIEMVAGYDGGATMTLEQKTEVNQIVEKLEKNGMEEPLKSPLVFGGKCVTPINTMKYEFISEWEVVFTSSPTAAGGGYRSAIGRALLRTKDLVQTIISPNVVGNKVAFDALGFIPGEVTLKGTFEALDDKWVKVTFDPPNLALGSAKFTYAKTSQVQLSVSYLDEKIRIGRGSRGSIFVFKRR